MYVYMATVFVNNVKIQFIVFTVDCQLPGTRSKHGRFEKRTVFNPIVSVKPGQTL